MKRTPYERVHVALHRLWSRAREQPAYHKSDWMELANAIDELYSGQPNAQGR